MDDDNEFPCSVARDLIDTGTDVNATNSVGETPMHTAVVTGDQECLKYLINNGGHLYATTFSCETILNYAASFSEHSSQILQFLLRNYPWNINDTDIKNNTILHNYWRGIDLGSLTCDTFYRCLLYGADVSIRNIDGELCHYHCQCDDFCNCPVYQYLSVVELVNCDISDDYVSKLKYYIPELEFVDVVMDNIILRVAIELRRLENLLLKSQTTVRDILYAKRTTLVSISKNDDLSNYVFDKLKSPRFSMTRDLVRTKFIKGKKRRDLIKQSREVFSCFAKLADCCVDKIVFYFNEKELMIFGLVKF